MKICTAKKKHVLNPNFPSILVDKPPALEPCRYQDRLFESVSAMKDARERFIRLEADERLKRAMRKKTRNIFLNFLTAMAQRFTLIVKGDGEDPVQS